MTALALLNGHSKPTRRPCGTCTSIMSLVGCCCWYQIAKFHRAAASHRPPLALWSPGGGRTLARVQQRGETQR